MLNRAIIVLDDQPELFLRLAEHLGEVNFVIVVEPEALLFADDLGKRCLVTLEAHRGFDI